MDLNRISPRKYYIVSKDFQSSIGPVIAGVKVLVVKRYITGVHDVDVRIVDLNDANTPIFAMKSENLEPLEVTKLQLESDLSRLKIQTKEIIQKLDWMKDNQLEVFDEEEFALFEALKIIESDEDPITKVKALKSIINNFRNEKNS